MPASPIDYIRDRLEAAGISTGEVTGRDKIVKDGVLAKRDRGGAANKLEMNRYNNGVHDALIINESGATGFSLHATAENDGKVRHMFVLQPHPNIDVFMQMLGRINRTGQIELPKYTIAVSDLAVEKRPAAILMRKLASLNANTTAAKDSAVSLDNVVDFMNRYGDEVVFDYLTENPELQLLIDNKMPTRRSEAISMGLAAKLTGKLAILDPEQVAKIYDDIERLYTAYIQELDATGQNALEAKVLDLKAKTISKTVVAKGKNPYSEFGSDAVLEDVDVRVIGKPYTHDKVRELVSEAEGEEGADAKIAAQMREIDQMAEDEKAELEKMRPKLEKALAEAKTDKQKDNAQDRINRLEVRLAAVDENAERLKAHVRGFRPGRPVIVKMLDDGGQTVDNVYGVTLGIDISRMKGRLGGMSRAMTRIAIASPARELRVPLTRFDGDGRKYELINASEGAAMRAFDEGQAEAWERRQIATGNIIAAMERFDKGQIIMFTREDGTTDQGLLLPKDYDAQKAIEDRPVVFKNLDHAIQFVDTAGSDHAPALLKSEDGVFSVHRTYSGYKLRIKRKGGKPYTLSPAARGLVGDFSTRSGDYVKDISVTQLKPLLEIYRDTLGATYIADAHKDEARAITGEEIPDFGGSGAKHVRDGEPVATLKGDELGNWTDVRQLGRKAEAWYRDNLLGTTVTNRETGWQIDFRRNGGKKIGGRKGDVLYRSIPALRAILEHGRHISSEPDNRGRPDIKAVHKFSATIMLDGKPRDLIVTVREDALGKYHYDLSRDVGDGARFMRDGGNAVRMGGAQVRNPALEGNTVELNMELAPKEGKTPPRSAPDRVAAVLSDVLRRVGLKGKVMGRAVRGLRDGAFVLAGRYQGGVIAVDDAATDPLGVAPRDHSRPARQGALGAPLWAVRA